MSLQMIGYDSCLAISTYKVGVLISMDYLRGIEIRNENKSWLIRDERAPGPSSAFKKSKAELMAVAGFDPNSYFPAQSINQSIKCYDNLDELLKDHDIDLISLCSPCRRNQAKDAIRCLNAGKSVYAEKPCAMEESELDRMIETSLKTGCCFHEMAGTAFEQPYLSMRQLVKEGVIGTVVQVFAQKSYPPLLRKASSG